MGIKIIQLKRKCKRLIPSPVLKNLYNLRENRRESAVKLFNHRFSQILTNSTQKFSFRNVISQ